LSPIGSEQENISWLDRLLLALQAFTRPFQVWHIDQSFLLDRSEV